MNLFVQFIVDINNEFCYSFLVINKLVNLSYQNCISQICSKIFTNCFNTFNDD